MVSTKCDGLTPHCLFTRLIYQPTNTTWTDSLTYPNVYDLVGIIRFHLSMDRFLVLMLARYWLILIYFHTLATTQLDVRLKFVYFTRLKVNQNLVFTDFGNMRPLLNSILIMFFPSYERWRPFFMLNQHYLLNC